MNHEMSVEKLREKHDKEMRELLMAREIMEALPRLPIRVLFALEPQPWIIYEVENLQRAVLLAEGFSNWAEYVHAKQGCTQLQPASRLKEKDPDKYQTYIDVQGGAPHLDLQTIEVGQFSADLVFFTNTVHGKTAKVLIKIKNPPARIHVVVLHDSRANWGRGRAEIRKDYPSLHADRMIEWSSGGEKSARATYVWYTVDSYQSAINTILENIDPEWRKENAEAA